jgi:NIPSNAP
MADKPVIDLRIYTIRPRGMPQYLKLFEELALPLALKHLGPPLGYYVTQIGPLNQVVHLWAFENLADLEQRHSALGADPEFAKYLAATDGLVVGQEDRIMRPVEFKSQSWPPRERV